MIRSFGDKETGKIFNREFSKKLPADIQRTARRKLEILDAAENLNDLRIPPSNRLEKLKDKRRYQHSFVSTTDGEFVLSGVMKTLSRLR